MRIGFYGGRRHCESQIRGGSRRCFFLDRALDQRQRRRLRSVTLDCSVGLLERPRDTRLVLICESWRTGRPLKFFFGRVGNHTETGQGGLLGSGRHYTPSLLNHSPPFLDFFLTPRMVNSGSLIHWLSPRVLRLVFLASFCPLQSAFSFSCCLV
ncbi:hypothetical protein VTH06DRAFT_2084 [Thermothelomyces fergusii]